LSCVCVLCVCVCMICVCAGVFVCGVCAGVFVCGVCAGVCGVCVCGLCVCRCAGHTCIFIDYLKMWPTPAFARSKASVCDRTLSGIAVSNPAWDMDVCLL